MKTHNCFSQNLFLVLTVLATLNLFSCVNDIPHEEQDLPGTPAPEANSQLTIITRTGEADAVISYPIHLYAFDTATKSCAGYQTIANANAKVSFRLPAGTYTILGFAGATTEKYNMPTKEKAAMESIITLKADASHADLMTSKSDVTLTEQSENTLTIALSRKVMMVNQVTLKNLPTDIKSVTLNLSSLYPNLKLDGTYVTTPTTTTNIPLTKVAGNTTWSAIDPIYMLPGSGNITVNISLTPTTGNPSTFSFGSTIKMEANYKMNITGTYSAPGLALTGTVTGATWAGNRDITFDFDKGGGSEGGGGSTGDGGTGGDTGDTGIPTVGSIYKNCYVLAVSATNVTLLSPKEKADVTKANINAAIAEHAFTEVAAADEWRLPNEDEAKLIYTAYVKKINDILKKTPNTDIISAQVHFYIRNGEQNAFQLNASSFQNSMSKTGTVRAVATLPLPAK